MCLTKFLLTPALTVMLAVGASASANDSANDILPTGTLPIVYIVTENGKPIVEKEEKIPAGFWIDPAQSGCAAFGSESNPVPFTVSGRGNYTWSGFDKKPYKVKFNEKQSLFNLPKSKHYALLAHADDELGFLRNTMGFELSRRLGLAWTPAQIPVELVINGEYRGLYFLTETIKVDSDRVDITPQDDLVADPSAITGGWLVEIDNYDSDPHIEIDEANSGYTIFFTYKSPEELSQEQENYLRSQLESVNRAICDNNPESVEWMDLIDLESAARYYVVQEIMDDCESYHGSCYIYKDLGDDKWHFGPVWDFGNALRRDHKNWIYHNPPFHQVWIGELAKFSAFQDKVKEVWTEFMTKHRSELSGIISSFRNEISAAAIRDAERWPAYGNSDMDQRASTFENRLNASISWLDNQFDPHPEITRVYVRGTFNNWDVTTPMSSSDGVVYTATLSSLCDEFKIASEDWKTVDFGADDDNTPVGYDVPYLLKEKGANMRLVENCNSSCYLIFNMKERTLTVSKKMSGVGSVSDPAAVNIRVEGHCIITDEPVCVYDLLGNRVASGNGTLPLPDRGLYIVVSRSASTKVRL